MRVLMPAEGYSDEWEKRFAKERVECQSTRVLRKRGYDVTRQRQAVMVKNKTHSDGHFDSDAVVEWW